MSIRARLLLLILFATLTPAIVVGVNFLDYRESEIAVARRQLSAMAQYIAKDLSDTIRGTLGGARAWDLISDRFVKNSLQTEHCPSCLTRLKSCLEKDADYGTRAAC